MTRKSDVPDWFRHRVTILLPTRPGQTVSDTMVYNFRLTRKAHMDNWLYVPAAYGLARWHGGIILKWEINPKS